MGQGDSEPVYEVRVDRERLLIDVTMSGFFSAEDAGWAGEQVRAAVQSLGAAAGRHVTLYDLTRMKVMNAEGLESVRTAILNPAVRPIWARRIAYVAVEALQRMQVRRMMALREGTALFSDRQAALDWLLRKDD